MNEVNELIYVKAIDISFLDTDIFQKDVTNNKKIKLDNSWDRKQSVFAEMLLRYGMWKEIGISNVKINYNQFKPYIEEAWDLDFSYTHSGKWVVCAISNNKIGVDVQKIFPNYIDIARRTFSKAEADTLKKMTGLIKEEYFYKLWVLKESYVKCIGTGMRIPFSSFVIKEEKEFYLEVRDRKMEQFQFFDKKIGSNYYFALCNLGKQKFKEDDVELVTANLLLE